MSLTSPWPLTPDAVRVLVPAFLCEELQRHPLSRTLHPTAFGHYPKAAGHVMSREQHVDNLVMYCTAGRGQLAFAGQRHDVRAGDVVVLPENVRHQYEADASDPWTLWWVHYEGLAAMDYHQQWQMADGGILHVGLSTFLQQQFGALLASRNTGYQLPTLIHASTGLAHLFTGITLAIERLRAANAASAGLLRARAHMESCLETRIDLDALAEIAGMSRWHFVKKYRQAFGYSPIQHFIHRKIERSCELLDANRMSITAVALHMGYDDPAYFSRLFKRITGISPQQYQQG